MFDNEIGKELYKIMQAFAQSFINYNLELILIPKQNIYFDLKPCETKEDLRKKLLSVCSRECFKTTIYKNKSLNDKYHYKNLYSLNKALETQFTFEDIALIYTKIGNGCNSKLADRFVSSNYDLELLNS